MKIHLCIESTNDSVLFKNFAEKGLKEITHQSYHPETEDILSMWNDLSLLSADTYVLFLKDGDKISIPNRLSEIDPSIDLYLLATDDQKSFPKIHPSPFSLSSFFSGCYNNSNFMIRADSCKKVTPDTSFGRAWLMDVVMSLLYVENVTAKELKISVVSSDSKSVVESVGGGDIQLKIIPSKYGYFLSDMMLMDVVKAKKIYAKKMIRKIKNLQLPAFLLFIKQLKNKKKYGLFFQSKLFKSKYEGNWKNIPIIINNFNRIDYLTQFIASLEKRGVQNIHILDNNSTYPPLLEYYKTTKYKVHYLGENMGYRALWKSKVYDLFKDDYYVYTDPDLVICDRCPNDFMDYFMSLHKKYNGIWKVGFSLAINDLPNCFTKKREVQQWEKQFEEIEIEENVFYAPIDTTFAIYKPFGISDNERSLRVAGDYSMRHLPWYVDSEHQSVEETYYINSCIRKTHWSVFK